jgi:hypothetical protein
MGKKSKKAAVSTPILSEVRLDCTELLRRLDLWADLSKVGGMRWLRCPLFPACSHCSCTGVDILFSLGPR